jgi:hypothetical protein
MRHPPQLNQRVRVPFGFGVAEGPVVQWYESPGGYMVIVDLELDPDFDLERLPFWQTYPLEEVEEIDEGEAGEHR